MRLSMRGNKSLLDAFDYVKEIEKDYVNRQRSLANALNYVNKSNNIDFSKVQKYQLKKFERIDITENISIEVDELLFEEVREKVKKEYPNIRLQYPFVCRIVLVAYLMNLLNVEGLKKEKILNNNNRNQNLKWAINQGIIIDNDIIEDSDLRGIYGIFVEEKCVYVGRSYSIYARMFMGDCHILNLKNKNHISSLITGFNNNKSISIRILERVDLIEDEHPAKEAQKLASRENFWIDFYQSKDECLEQFPEGRWH